MGKEPLQQGNWRWNGREWVDVTRERPLPWAMIGGVAAAVVGVAILFYAGALLFERAGRPGPSASPAPAAGGAATPSSRASATPSARPTATASAPTSSAAIKSVAVALNGGCSPGSSCALEVTVTFPLATASQDFAWTLQATDACTGAVTLLGDDHVTAEAGWNHVVGDRTVTLPAAKAAVRVTAVTTAPDRVTSPALDVGSGSC